jgi:hypothetical protein
MKNEKTDRIIFGVSAFVIAIGVLVAIMLFSGGIAGRAYYFPPAASQDLITLLDGIRTDSVGYTLVTSEAGRTADEAGYAGIISGALKVRDQKDVKVLPSGFISNPSSNYIFVGVMDTAQKTGSAGKFLILSQHNIAQFVSGSSYIFFEDVLKDGAHKILLFVVGSTLDDLRNAAEVIKDRGAFSNDLRNNRCVEVKVESGIKKVAKCKRVFVSRIIEPEKFCSEDTKIAVILQTSVFGNLRGVSSGVQSVSLTDDYYEVIAERSGQTRLGGMTDIVKGVFGDKKYAADLSKKTTPSRIVFSGTWRDDAGVSGSIIGESTIEKSVVDTDGDGSCDLVGHDCMPNDKTIFPGAPEVCNGKDDNCDGKIDRDASGNYLTSQSDCNVRGECAGAVKTCSNGVFTALCSKVPGTEVCNGKDDDCDGITDEDALGNPLKGASDCYVKGECAGAVKTCSNGVFTGLCSKVPGTEVCNGKDDNCDGTVDNDLTPPLAAKQVGVCAGSKKLCLAGATDWSEPSYQNIPGYEIAEIKCDNLDNDCDGAVDEGCTTIFSYIDSVVQGNKNAFIVRGSGSMADSSASIGLAGLTGAEIIKDIDASFGSNYILVGGPCANKAVAILEGKNNIRPDCQKTCDSQCISGYSQGYVSLKVYEQNGKTHLVISGYSAEDTQAGGRLVVNYASNKDKLSVSEIKIQSSTIP